jgi:hypothetical protein
MRFILHLLLHFSSTLVAKRRGLGVGKKISPWKPKAYIKIGSGDWI